MEQLDLPHYTFDSVLCRWGLMFLPNLVDALGRLQRLLRPGGKIAGAVWAEASKVPSISLAMSVVREALHAPPPPAGLPGPFSLADPEHLEDVMLDAGFVEFHCEPVLVEFEVPSPRPMPNSPGISPPLSSPCWPISRSISRQIFGPWWHRRPSHLRVWTAECVCATRPSASWLGNTDSVRGSSGSRPIAQFSPHFQGLL